MGIYESRGNVGIGEVKDLDLLLTPESADTAHSKNGAVFSQQSAVGDGLLRGDELFCTI